MASTLVLQNVSGKYVAEVIAAECQKRFENTRFIAIAHPPNEWNVVATGIKTPIATLLLFKVYAQGVLAGFKRAEQDFA